MRRTVRVAVVAALMLPLAPARAADYTWTGAAALWNTANWVTTTGTTTFPAGNSAANTAFINSGTVTFAGNDTFGNDGTTSSPVIRIGTGGTLASGGKFNTMWNMNLDGGTLLANGGVNATYGSFQLAGTLSVTGTTAASISDGGGTNNQISIGGNGNGTLTINVADVTSSTAADLTVGVVLKNGVYGTALTKSGSGTLVLSAANTYTGVTTISAGALGLSGAGSLSSTGIVAITGTAATFDISAASAGRTLGLLTGTVGSSVALGANSLTVGNATSGTFAGAIGGTGGLTKQGTGSLTLTGANTYTGATTVTAGALVVGTGGSIGSAGNVNTTGGGLLSIAGTITMAANTYFAVGNGILNTTGTTSIDGGALNVGTNAFLIGGSRSGLGATGGIGTFVVNSGTVTVGAAGGTQGGQDANNVYLSPYNTSGTSTLLLNGGVFSTARPISDGGGNKSVMAFNGGTFQFGASINSFGATSNVIHSGGAVIDSNTFSGTFNTVLATGTGATAGGLTKIGSGTLALSAANTFTGTTRINAGVLSITNTNGLQNSTLDMNVLDSGTITFAQTSTIGGLSGSRNLDMGTRTLSFGNNNQNTTYSGTLSNGAFTKVGSGTLTLTATAATSVATTVSGGVLALSGGNNRLGTSSAIALAGGTLDLGGNAQTTSANVAFSGNSGLTSGTLTSTLGGGFAPSGTLTLGANAAFVANLANQRLIMQGISLTLTGSAGSSLNYGGDTANSANYVGVDGGGLGTLTVNGPTVNFVIAAGQANASGGWLRIGANSGAGGVVNVQSGTINVGHSASLGARFNNDGNATANSGTLTITGGAFNVGTGSLTTTSGGANGYLYLINDNAGSTGNAIVNLNGGLLSVKRIVPGTGGGTKQVNFNGGSLVAAASDASFMNAATGFTVNVGNAGGTIDTGTFAISVSAPLLASGTGGMTKAGAGTLTLTGSSTYTGPTTISGGTLALSGSGALVTTAQVGLTASGAAFAIAAAGNRTIAGLTGVAGSIVTLGSNRLTVGDATSGTFAGAIGGIGGGLIKQGSGTLTLAGVSTYTGTTSIVGGVLEVTGGLDDAGSVRIEGGTYRVGASDTIGALTLASGVIDGAGAITAGGVTLESGTLAGLLEFPGGATKTTTGTVTVTGSVGAPIAVTLGTLAGTGTVGDVGVGDGATVANGNGDTATFTLGSLVFGGTGSMIVNLPAGQPATPAIAIAGDLTLAAGVGLTVPTAPGWVWATGSSYTLASYGGAFTGTTSDFVITPIVGLGARQTPTLSTTAPANGVLLLTIDGDAPVWTGAVSNAWTTAPVDNWELVIGGGTTTFLTNDAVQFDDSATTTSVAITTANVGVASVLFDNATRDYTVTSAGGFGIADGSGTPATFTKSGTGRVTLATPNTYTGITTINAGTLQLGDGTTDGSIAGASIVNNSALAYVVTGSQTYAGVIGGSGTLTKAGAGTLTLTGANTYGGATSVGGGTLAVGTGGSIAAAGSVTTTAGGRLSISGSVTMAANTFFAVGNGIAGTTGTTTIDGGSLAIGTNAFLIGGSRSGLGATAGIGVFAVTSGTVTVGAAGGTQGGQDANAVYLNRYAAASGTSQLLLDGGVFSTARQIADGGSGGASLMAFNGGTLRLGASLTDITAGISSIVVHSGGAVVDTNGFNGTFSQPLASGTGSSAGGLTKQGAGTLTLSATNTFAGDTTISGGTLAVGGSGVLGGGSYSGAIANGGALVISSSANQTFSGAISGAGSLTKSGVGALTLSGSNTFSGGMALSAGQLNINAPSALGTGTFALSGGSIDNTSGAPVTLTGGLPQAWNADVTFAGSNALDLGTGTVTLGGSRTVTVAANTLTVGGPIAGAFTLTKQGSGTLALAALNTYSGSTTVSAGVLRLTGGTNPLSQTAAITLTGGTLDLGGNSQTTSAAVAFSGVSGLASGTLTSTAGGSFTPTGTLTLGPNTAFVANLAGQRLLLMTSTSTLTGSVGSSLNFGGNDSNVANFVGVDGANGALTVNGPTLNVQIANGGFATGGWLRIGANNGATGLVTLQSGTINVGHSTSLGAQFAGDASAATTSSGTLTITGGAFVVGTGTLTTTSGGANGYLYLKTNGASSTGNAIVNLNGGLLSAKRIVPGTGGGTKQLNLNGGTLVAAASDTSFMNAAPGFTVNVGNAGGTIDTGTFAITVAAPLLAGGTGGITKVGAGLLELTGASTFTGRTVIAGGTLALGPAASLASSFIKAGDTPLDGGTFDVADLTGGLVLASGQTLGGHGTVLGDVVVANGAIVSPGGSIGTLDVSGSQTWGPAGRYLFEIANAGGTPGVGWDLLTVDALAITATTGLNQQFVIDVQTLANAADDVAGPMAGGSWNPDYDYRWRFLVADTTTFNATNFDPAWFTVNSSPSIFKNDVNGTFSVARGGLGGLGGVTNANELYVVYAAVPEPGARALAVIGAVAAAWSLRRGRIRRSDA